MRKSAESSLENDLTEEACLNDVIGPIRIDLTGNDLSGFALSAAGAACGLVLFLTAPSLGGGRRLRQRHVPGTSQARS